MGRGEAVTLQVGDLVKLSKYGRSNVCQTFESNVRPVGVTVICYARGILTEINGTEYHVYWLIDKHILATMRTKTVFERQDLMRIQ